MFAGGQLDQRTDPDGLGRWRAGTELMQRAGAPVAPPNASILRGSIVSGVSNGVINCAIQWFLLRGSASIPLSVNGITNDEKTVFGMAVPLAVSIAMILTVVAYLSLKQAKRPFFPDVLWLTIKHGVFAFGLSVAGAVVWQRLMGTIPVSLGTAVVVLGVVAGVVGALINYMTIRSSLLRTA
ncbi:MAG: hypothetical protein ABI343_10285 [Burkholderiaceae bacterium]